MSFARSLEIVSQPVENFQPSWSSFQTRRPFRGCPGFVPDVPVPFPRDLPVSTCRHARATYPKSRTGYEGGSEVAESSFSCLVSEHRLLQVGRSCPIIACDFTSIYCGRVRDRQDRSPVAGSILKYQFRDCYRGLDARHTRDSSVPRTNAAHTSRYNESLCSASLGHLFLASLKLLVPLLS